LVRRPAPMRRLRRLLSVLLLEVAASMAVAGGGVRRPAFLSSDIAAHSPRRRPSGGSAGHRLGALTLLQEHSTVDSGGLEALDFFDKFKSGVDTAGMEGVSASTVEARKALSEGAVWTVVHSKRRASAASARGRQPSAGAAGTEERKGQEEEEEPEGVGAVLKDGVLKKGSATKRVWKWGRDLCKTKPEHPKCQIFKKDPVEWKDEASEAPTTTTEAPTTSTEAPTTNTEAPTTTTTIIEAPSTTEGSTTASEAPTMTTEAPTASTEGSTRKLGHNLGNKTHIDYKTVSGDWQREYPRPESATTAEERGGRRPSSRSGAREAGRQAARKVLLTVAAGLSVYLALALAS